MRAPATEAGERVHATDLRGQSVDYWAITRVGSAFTSQSRYDRVRAGDVQLSRGVFGIQ